MKKHISVEAVVVKGFNKILFKVKEQTHTGATFGSALYGNKFRASNGVTLGSNKNPARDTADKATVWLRGSNTKLDNTAVACTTKEWAKIAKAIEEYNAYEFAAPRKVAAPAAPKANLCVEIVG